MTLLDTLTVAIKADTSDFVREMGEADKLAKGFGRTLTTSFASAAARGASLGSVLNTVATKLNSMALQAALKPLGQGLAQGLEGLIGGFSGLGDGVEADATLLSGLTPFAKGGVIASPHYFPLGAGQTGVAGEAGAEAILPLARGPDGRLGVASQGAGAAHVTVNIATPDVAGFRRSQTEIAASLARAVTRGQRGL